MANSTLQGLFRESSVRATDRATFAYVISRLSSAKDKKVEDQQKSEKDAERQPE